MSKVRMMHNPKALADEFVKPHQWEHAHPHPYNGDCKDEGCVDCPPGTPTPMVCADWIKAVLQGVQSAKCRWDCTTFVAAVFGPGGGDSGGREGFLQKQWETWSRDPVGFFFGLDIAYQERFIKAVEMVMVENEVHERARFASIGADPGSECKVYRQDVVDRLLTERPSHFLEAIKYIRDRRGVSLADAKHEAEKRRDELQAAAKAVHYARVAEVKKARRGRKKML